MAVTRIEISKLKPQATRLAGSTIGTEHARQLNEQIAGIQAGEGGLLAFDFADVEAATASYLKRVLNPFLVDGAIPDADSRRFSPVAVNATAPDLLEDLEEYLCGKSRVLILAEVHDGQLWFSRLLGRLEGAAAETFAELRRLKQVTAQQLFELHPDRTTNQTAWNNRLTQLVDLRVARRRREGRFWIYQPTVTT